MKDVCILVKYKGPLMDEAGDIYYGRIVPKESINGLNNIKHTVNCLYTDTKDRALKEHMSILGYGFNANGNAAIVTNIIVGYIDNELQLRNFNCSSVPSKFTRTGEFLIEEVPGELQKLPISDLTKLVKETMRFL